MKCLIKSPALQKPRDNTVSPIIAKQVYKLLHVYYSFHKRFYVLGLLFDTWVFIILMLVKVERQCWLENKCTRGIAVTRYT